MWIKAAVKSVNPSGMCTECHNASSSRACSSDVVCLYSLRQTVAPRPASSTRVIIKLIGEKKVRFCLIPIKLSYFENGNISISDKYYRNYNQNDLFVESLMLLRLEGGISTPKPGNYFAHRAIPYTHFGRVKSHTTSLCDRPVFTLSYKVYSVFTKLFLGASMCGLSPPGSVRWQTVHFSRVPAYPCRFSNLIASFDSALIAMA